MKNYRRYLVAVVLLFGLTLKPFAQQPTQIKVSEFSVSNIPSIEDRVFMVHSILAEGYICYKNPNLSNTIDVYMTSDASDELSDFDFFYDYILYNQLNEFSNLDKIERGELFVEYRQSIQSFV